MSFDFDLCRFCFKLGSINIFDEKGRTLRVIEIASDHLKCEVNEK